MESPVYLDYNATTPIHPEVFEAMRPYLTLHFGNPSSSHVYGRAAREAVERARAQVAQAIGASSTENITFTSSGTEATNTVIASVCGNREASIVCSEIEHPATKKACAKWADETHQVQVDTLGTLRTEDLARHLTRDNVRLLSLMHANNEIGTIQPVRQASDMAHEKGVLVHCDAAQSLGKIPVHVDALGIDFMTLVGHKIYAPKGIGVLYTREGHTLEPLLVGGGQERGVRAGTENVPYIVAMGHACMMAARDVEAQRAHLASMRRQFLLLLQQGIPELMINGHLEARLPNTLHVSFPDVEGAQLLQNTPQVAASVGAACHEGEVQMSQTLRAIGCTPERARGAVRFSLGRGTNHEELELAARSLVDSWNRLRPHTA